MNRTVLITGAYGFIGRYTALEYHNNSYNVIGMGHGNWRENEYKNWGIHLWHLCDITIENLIAYAQNPDLIVHCAGSGSVGQSIVNPMKDFDRTVGTTHYILEYIRIHSPQTKLIYPSSAAVYGMVDHLPISESALLKPISPYGVHKKIAEELCQMYCRQYNLSVLIMRLFSVYGNGLRKQLLWDACKKIELDDVNFWGTGQETRDWIHVIDAAELLYIAKNKTSSSCPIVNVGSGESTSVSYVLEALFKCFKKNHAPVFGGEVNIGNPIHYFANIDKIMQWGWKSKILLQDGIREYAQWYKEEKCN